MEKIISLLVTVIIFCMFSPGFGEKISRVDDTGASPEGVKAIIDANNQFAFELYAQFNEQSKDLNTFYSPYSILTALTMTYEGARGQTAEEMQSVLHIPEIPDARRPNFASIYNEINKKDKAYKLSTANALWAQKDYCFLEEYTNSVEKYYGGKVTNLDFTGASEKSRQAINKWVEDQTNNKIKDLIPKGLLNADTRLVLTNAIYFKGTWVKQFDEKDTKEDDFRMSTGNTVKVPMMRLTGNDAKFNYAETDEIQILEMPYSGEEISMLIILPKENDLASIEKSITLEKLSEWKNILNERRVDIFIPKFKFETKYFMAKALSDMGMDAAFGSTADFSGMDGTRDLFMQNVIHQAFVEVNEEGTEAAAATGVVMGITSVGPMIPIFRADHPFIFIIQESETGNILFLGKVTDPSK
ncbi:MAG: serpin family protein [bacterium]